MKENISKLHDCYGCGVCVKACPVKIISLKENKDGFYAPHITEADKCIECGLCLKICSFNDTNIPGQSNQINAYAAWSRDPLVRQWCSSGGIGFEIGRKLINDSYQAVGVRFNPSKNRAEHYVATTVEEFMPSVGSKYIPSYTTDAFKQIDLKKKYLITGTPCQIDSFRRYIRHFKVEDNFILLDFFCHGVPTLLLWDKYISEVRKKIGDISFVSWRNKTTGWHDSWSMNTDSYNKSGNDWKNFYNLNNKERKHSYSSRISEGDLFYRFFLGNYCLNKCCYASCKYKMCNTAADIRIGDLWGKKYSHDDKGVSSVLIMTEKGRKVLESLLDKCILIPERIDVATEGQMKSNAYKPDVYKYVMRLLQSSISLYSIYFLLVIPTRIKNKILKIINK